MHVIHWHNFHWCVGHQSPKFRPVSVTKFGLFCVIQQGRLAPRTSTGWCTPTSSGWSWRRSFRATATSPCAGKRNYHWHWASLRDRCEMPVHAYTHTYTHIYAHACTHYWWTDTACLQHDSLFNVLWHNVCFILSYCCLILSYCFASFQHNVSRCSDFSFFDVIVFIYELS